MKLAEGVAALGLSLPLGAEDRLAAYLELLAKWNRVYNLTAIRDPEKMVSHHLLDSLAVLPVLEKSTVVGQPFQPHLVDVGSGAGLPGLVLAVARPEWKIVSVEAVEKKAAFQRQARIELGLTNVSIHCGRVEDLAGCFDGVLARAYASLAEFVHSAGHLSDTLWAMKGGYPVDELGMLPPAWGLVSSQRLVVPGLAAERHLLQLGRI